MCSISHHILMWLKIRLKSISHIHIEHLFRELGTKYCNSVFKYAVPVSLGFAAVSASPALIPVILSPNVDVLIHTLFFGLKARCTNSSCSYKLAFVDLKYIFYTCSKWSGNKVKVYLPGLCSYWVQPCNSSVHCAIHHALYTVCRHTHKHISAHIHSESNKSAWVFVPVYSVLLISDLLSQTFYSSFETLHLGSHHFLVFS